MQLATSIENLYIYISYHLSDIVDSYAAFRCHDGGTSIKRVILQKPLNGRLQNLA